MANVSKRLRVETAMRDCPTLRSIWHWCLLCGGCGWVYMRVGKYEFLKKEIFLKERTAWFCMVVDIWV